VPALVQREGANIITISSVNAVLPDPAVIEYSAAKGALTNLCKSLSKESGGRIRVNTISPGPVQTDLWLGADGVVAAVANSTTSAEGAQNADVTGSDYVIDGGLVATV
jgi:NAD(P)-dependent dehydrogenase (short-subunit alcohol dehydrogenase family)